MDSTRFVEFYNSFLGFNPYDYQKRTAEFLLDSKNVILSVPTGAGKTWASIMPFIYSAINKDNIFPQKLIYSLPLRTLANSIYNDINKILSSSNLFNNSISIHTGEYKNDEDFENDIIFSTIDQTLSNFLCFPFSKSKRQANINAGSLIGSYLVFDEFHLLDPKLAMATTLGTLKLLKGLSRFCIMTATLSDTYIRLLKDELNAEVVHIDDFPEDAMKINSLIIPENKSFKKSISVIDNIVSSQIIKEKHKSKTIVICNRVENAQRIYIELNNDKEFKNTEIICLHSRFFDVDRKEKEIKLKQLLGKKSDANVILISTQVIEAGMDISCETMHLEVSPINSLLQRAGRCARWEGEYGDIYIYDIISQEEKNELADKDKKYKYLPYDFELCENTFTAIKQEKFIDKDISQRLVDKILSLKEKSDFDKIYQSDGGFNKGLIKKSWQECSRNSYSSTIRKIDTLEIVIFDCKKYSPETFYPYKYETIGLFRYSFIKWAKIIQENKLDEDDVIYIVEDIKDTNILDSFAFENEGYTLKPISNIDELKNYYDLVFVDKSVLRYTKEAGLELGNGSICSPIKEHDKNEKEAIVYKKDTFYQHNRAIVNCYLSEFKPKLNKFYKQLSDYWEEEIDWDFIIKTMIYFHDYGKLNDSWQRPMQMLQKLKHEKEATFSFIEDEILAHSDFSKDADNEIEKQSKAKQKPPHAGVGAYAFALIGEDILEYDCNEELTKCITTAILKHHGVETESFKDFNISDINYKEVIELLKELKIDIDLIQKDRGEILTDYIADVTEEREWITYLFLVRILRLCDQKATKDISKYLNI